ncbi:unnamed protein product [Rhizoctonia solani]|uniref:Uncharacterized protein n=1 Tax=Rhizoctonia solani TaxID=456999 RepID=A0A8H2XP88_9AGAM|nr:unnamed protein product [Rhizoctonia solani]
MRTRAQSFTEKNVARRRISADRVSEFWSAGANESIRGRTMSGDSTVGGTDTLRNSQRPPTRPVRSGETEADLRIPGRVRFMPNAMMSDHTGLSTDVQLHGSAQSSEVNMDSHIPNPLSTNSAVAPANSAVAEQSSIRTKHDTYTLDQDPFAASPMVPMPTTATPPLSIHVPTFPPYVSNFPHTVGDTPVVPSSQFAANFSPSHSNTTASPSESAALGSSFGSTNMLGLSSSLSSTPYVPAGTVAPLRTPTSAAMYDSVRDSTMSDPFAYDNAVRSRATTVGEAPLPSPGVTWTNVNLGVASPPVLHIARTSSGIQTSPLASPYLSPSSPLSGLSVTSPALNQAPLLSAALQSDVSQALSQFQRRMSASTVGTRFSQQTDYQYQPSLDGISDNDERSFAFFMHNSSSGPSQSIPSVPRLKVSKPPVPETLQMQPTKTKSKVAEDGSPMYSSTISLFDHYHQGNENGSRSRSGSRR